MREHADDQAGTPSEGLRPLHRLAGLLPGCAKVHLARGAGVTRCNLHSPEPKTGFAQT